MARSDERDHTLWWAVAMVVLVVAVFGALRVLDFGGNDRFVDVSDSDPSVEQVQRALAARDIGTSIQLVGDPVGIANDGVADGSHVVQTGIPVGSLTALEDSMPVCEVVLAFPQVRAVEVTDSNHRLLVVGTDAEGCRYVG